jgi:peptidoglycan-associated lipoprotein
MQEHHQEHPAKSLLVLLAAALLAGCAVVPAEPVPLVSRPYGPAYYYYYYPDSNYVYPHHFFPGSPAAYPPPPPPRVAIPRALHSIYFDPDQSALRPDAVLALNENLEWFRQNPGRKVVIQGNCDPRASREHNLGLGQRRAHTAREYLLGLGVDAALLETASHGKDRPSCHEKSESCWQRERRVDFQPMP